MHHLLDEDGIVDSLAKDMESHMEEVDAEVEKRLESVDLESMSQDERWKFNEEMLERVLKESTNIYFPSQFDQLANL